MARKVFLSFLGTSFYHSTFYIANGQKEEEIKPTRFIQEATLTQFCNDFCENDKIFIFTTNQALVNWEDNDHINPSSKKNEYYYGLKTCLNNLNISCNIENIIIPDGRTTDEIWEIFRIVFNLINEEDELIFDITHGFRSLPMLNMVLINYAKLLKNISVTGIYYGAYDAKYPYNNNSFSPIWNLKDFENLQEWTNSAQLFLKAGYSESIVKMMSENGIESAENIDEFSKEILSNRSIKITEGESSIFIKDLLQKESISETHPAIKPIFQLIEKQFEHYKKNNILNALPAIEWCINHNLIQQGYTIMSEFLISYALNFIGEDYRLKDLRNSTNGFMSIEGKIEKFNFLEDKRDKQELLLNKLSRIPFFKELCKRNRSINAENRDDINHGGYREKPKDYNTLKHDLSDKYKKLLVVISKIEESKPSPMLLNFSNHPSTNWPENQISAAIEKYQSIQDLPFPSIDPEWRNSELDQLVEEYEIKIKKLQPTAVHIMGELTFTHQLVNRLKLIGIPCIASTTKRNVIEQDNKKTSVFEFVDFRAY